MSTSPSVSRRAFLGAAGAAAAAVAWTATSYAKVIGANDRIRIGFIGVGGMGNAHLDAIDELEGEGQPRSRWPWPTAGRRGPRTGPRRSARRKSFADYRKVLDIKDIDYVTIATPEHWHAKMTIDAMDAGKAVYCEKPMTHTIPEAQAVMKKQKETGLAAADRRAGHVGRQLSHGRPRRFATGMLGQVVQAQIEYVRRYDKQGPWRDPDIKDDTPQAGTISIGTPGSAMPRRSPGIRTIISNGATTRPTPAASAPICSSIASRGS